MPDPARATFMLLRDNLLICQAWQTFVYPRLSQVPLQAVYKKQEAVLEDLKGAAQEIAEMHELLMVHKQRIPTVDTVNSFPCVSQTSATSHLV